MKALDRKLVRDLAHMWAQAIAIAAVMGAGVATLVLATGAYRSLLETRAAYYERYRFADVFASVTRADRRVGERIMAIADVQVAELRIKKLALIEVTGRTEPATGVAISLPDRGEPALNRLHLRIGRMPEPGRTDEVVVNEAFANANYLRPGDRFSAVLNGRKRALAIAGIALSPEFIYALGPGDLMPDDRRFAVFWMSETALGQIFDMVGAFNDIAVKLAPGANEPEVIRQLDSLLARYGGIGASSRKDQQSHAFLDAELKQLAAMAKVVPPIFLLVSAFLVNMALSRLIALEREQIGLLKAIGYGRWTVAGHYVKLVLAISFAGIAMGAAAGTWLGHGLTRLYGDFFHFPFLLFEHDADIYAMAAGVTFLAAVAGAALGVRGVVLLPPAVAMQPPAPPRYHHMLRGRLAVLKPRSMLLVMAFRDMVRAPIRTATTTVGIALAVSVLVTALFTFDSVEQMIDVAFFQTDRQHATLEFKDEKGVGVLGSAARLPGVLRAEPFRSVAVRMRNGHLERKVAILGKPADMDLSRVLDLSFTPLKLPQHGIVISERLASVLALAAGDQVEIEVLEGRRRSLFVTVAEVIKSYFGLVVYMDIAVLNEVLDEGLRFTGVHVAYDRAREPAFFAEVKRAPAISSIALQSRSLIRFRETLAQNINIMTSVYLGLSCIIAFGVVYNSARIQLSERARELASLRVLGFTRREVTEVLLMGLALMTLAALPLGWLLGHWFAWATVQGFTNDLYTVPFAIEPATYAKSSLVVIAASALSALIVRARINRLDLIAVLKARD